MGIAGPGVGVAAEGSAVHMFVITAGQPSICGRIMFSRNKVTMMLVPEAVVDSWYLSVVSGNHYIMLKSQRFQFLIETAAVELICLRTWKVKITLHCCRYSEK